MALGRPVHERRRPAEGPPFLARHPASGDKYHPGARPARYEATHRPTGDPFEAPSDPLAEFLVERYRFYTEAPDGSLRYSAVHHDPWTLYPAEPTVDTDTLLRAEGFRRPDAEPTYYYSPGLDVVASPSNPATEGE